MTTRIALHHRTHYQYDRLISLGPQVVRLRPAPHSRVPIEAYSLNISPDKFFLNWQQDPFGNYCARAVFYEKTDFLSVEVDLVAQLPRVNPFDFFMEAACEDFPFVYEPHLRDELAPYLEIKERGPKLMENLCTYDKRKRNTVTYLVETNAKCQRDISYLIRMEPGVQTCEETLTKRSGSCRDSAWLLCQLMRHMGLASRFVSGYLVQLTPDVEALDGPPGPTTDFCDLHAWTEVYIPGAGWVGLDPTSGLFAGEGHIPLACTPHPVSAGPITGALEECETEFSFDMKLIRLHEDARVTKPFTPEDWAKIDAIGTKVDQDLDRLDVRLTMGGEPTFVSVDDMDSPQWNTAALGADKRRLANDLLRRMHKQLAPQGLLQLGQGKWYPGEELPRWAFSCYWRIDNQPVWHDPSLFADDNVPGTRTLSDAYKFIQTLAQRLGVATSFIQPGFEDVYYYLWKERNLPKNVDPLKADLKDGNDRKRLAKLLEKGLEKVTGYMLPLRWQDLPAPGGWFSSEWTFRPGRLYLLPGDSPMGFRLPLESIEYEPEDKQHKLAEVCTMETKPALTDIIGEVAKRYSRYKAAPLPGPDFHGIQEQTADEAAEAKPASTAGQVRTAMCIEPRNGHIYIFLPPVSHLEHFLDLIACIEGTAAELEMPVIIEGYQPPRDPRLQNLAITPDPGVIEVNLPPSNNWKELRDLTALLYEEARLCRLGTEKFMHDGRHTGTGGGNHVTFGGKTPADSPMLRRPDLLRSLLTFWQHHPSLSYMFSGMFLGPTSQAPRVDEARHEGLYELEIAFQQMSAQEHCFPWLVDRLLRNLLIDVTGNTHRTEFCIDKLFSPDGFTGRLGIVELRSLEMPPHYQMSLLTQVLLRALIARFYDKPYAHNLVRWGTGLHDRFMLPHYLWRDLQEVVADLNRQGYPFQGEWFAPNFEFRFPILGEVKVDDLHLELRSAIEPWHVLGEEAAAGGMARYVDSSVERLQVKVTGMTNPRHVVACNGRRVPLRSTGTPGEYVAGVRYRAWQPPSALHPTIPVQAPLVFDVVDTWNEHAVGGCTYHVSHPGGRSNEECPINSYAAESRRLARFWPYGHTPGPTVPAIEELNKDYPHTLDLRRVMNS